MKGIGASGGIGVGSALILREQSLTYQEPDTVEPAREQERLQQALDVFCRRTGEKAAKLEGASGEILRGHIMMAQDPEMRAQMQALLESGKCAEAALDAVCELFITVFSQAEDELTQQRAADVRDIKNGVLKILLGVEETDLSQLPADTILVAEELTPSMTTGLDRRHIAGILTEKGGRNSHSAILSRAFSIPAVLSASEATKQVRPGATVVLDGDTGEVWIDPAPELLAHYRQKQAEDQKRRDLLQQMRGRRTQTADGEEKELFANIGSPEDLDLVLENDAEGIGLFRTEFLFMDRAVPPDEEEQFEAYRRVAVAMKGRPVIIRTLDIGGDKEVPCLDLKKEENPFLGYRAVRFCLGHEALCRTQLRAILRASHFGEIRLMIPLVTNLAEVQRVRALIREEQQALSAAEIPYDPALKVGVMIETPAACMIADLLAEEADFFSIGTNDLTQYIMAADRGNAEVAYLYSTFDPAVLRSIRQIIQAAHQAQIPVGMCGEAAADPKMIPLLLAMGLDEFSVSPASVLQTRAAIAACSRSDAQALSGKIFSCGSAAQAERLLEEAASKNT